MKRFTPLHPESPSLQTGDEGQIKIKLSKNPHPLGWGVTGFTLIELVMVMVIVSILAGIGVPVMLATSDAWSFASHFQNFGVQSAIVAANRMSKEIRLLKNNSSITSAQVSLLTFVYRDFGFVDHTVTFDLDSNTLRRTEGANIDGLCDNVSSLAFTYYDDDGNTISVPVSSANLLNIRRINVDFSILAGTNTLNFQFQPRPQNIKRLNEKVK